MIELSDAVYILFLAIVVWIAVQISDGGGGGRRARIPIS